MRKALIPSLLLIGACASVMPSPRTTLAQPLTVTPRNARVLTGPATDQHGNAFNLTGLSGITHAGGGVFWAVQDNSNKLVEFSVTFDADGDTSAASVVRGLSLAETMDFEGIAYTNAARNSVFLSEEGTPGVREYDLATGARLQTLSRPIPFNNARANFGFESLARRVDGAELWTANEEALASDGGVSTPSAGSPVRLLHYALSGNSTSADAQYVYVTDPMHGGVTNGGRSGLVDLVVLPTGTLLALERSLADPPGLVPASYQSRIYEIDFAGATDVTGLVGVDGEAYTPVSKRLLWSGPAGSLFGQNLEGLALGPQLANGNWSLLGVVDDGDGVLSNDTLVAFELSGANIPEPAIVGAGVPLGAWWFLHMWRRR